MFIRTFLLITGSLFLTACNISGSGQKGPFTSGTEVSLSKLDDQASPISSTTINTQIRGSQGYFSINGFYWTGWSEIQISGLFFNEYTNANSSELLTLSTITLKNSFFDFANVHLFSHLAAARIRQRVLDGQSLNHAWADAQADMATVFGLQQLGSRGVEQLNLLNGSGRNNLDNATLLLFTGSFLAVEGNETSLQALVDDFSDDGQFNGVGQTVFNNIAIAAGERGLLERLSQNLSNNGTVNPPTTDDMPTLPIWVSENTPPIANDQAFQVVGDSSFRFVLGGSDADNDNLTFRIVVPPSSGILDGSTPNIQYRPNIGFVGSDSFSFVVNDGTVDSAPATVNIRVKAPYIVFPSTITATGHVDFRGQPAQGYATINISINDSNVWSGRPDSNGNFEATFATGLVGTNEDISASVEIEIGGNFDGVPITGGHSLPIDSNHTTFDVGTIYADFDF